MFDCRRAGGTTTHARTVGDRFGRFRKDVPPLPDTPDLPGSSGQPERLTAHPPLVELVSGREPAKFADMALQLRHVGTMPRRFVMPRAWHPNKCTTFNTPRCGGADTRGGRFGFCHGSRAPRCSTASEISRVAGIHSPCQGVAQPTSRSFKVGRPSPASGGDSRHTDSLRWEAKLLEMGGSARGGEPDATTERRGRLPGRRRR